MPPASAVGSDSTHARPTSRGLPPAAVVGREPRGKRLPSPKRDSQGMNPLSGCGPAVPAASAVGDVFTHPSPTSRGLGCFVSFLSGGRARTRRTAHEQGPSACGVLGDGRRGDERRSPKRDSQGSGPLSGRGQSPPFSRRDGWGMRRRWEGWKAGILQGMESWAWARAGCSQRKAGVGRRAL